MKSPCLQCAKPVAHLIHERPFCSVACNADYAMGRCLYPEGTDDTIALAGEVARLRAALAIVDDVFDVADGERLPIRMTTVLGRLERALVAAGVRETTSATPVEPGKVER